MLAFMPKNEAVSIPEDTVDDCSDVLVVSHDMAIAVHNEDANVALVGHTYVYMTLFSKQKHSTSGVRAEVILTEVNNHSTTTC